MPFRHPDRSHDLATRIDLEVRERLEEAVDFVCLEALVRARRQRDLPAPAADSAADRSDYAAHVSAFVDLLQRELTRDLTAEQRRTVHASRPSDGHSEPIAVQTVLARMLPDYWQRFDAARAHYLEQPTLGDVGQGVRGGYAPPDQERSGAPPSAPLGGEGRGLLARLFGRG